MAPMPTGPVRWCCAPYSVAEADRVARELDLSPTTAAILARRGYATPAQARRFLAADERHDPRLLGQVDAACELILRHVARGSRIVVHGDYDVDGVCSTTIMVEALRALGADPRWHLPDRLDGYGLSEATVERLAAAGTGLVVTVDCGITAPDEVAAARARGMDVVVTDHHRFGERLPDCPIVHPALGYPFDGLCAAAVAHKLSTALSERAGLDPARAEAELDLVGLATVCDLVPLRDENRRLATEGLRALTRTARPGLRALKRVAGLDDGEPIDERAAGFRLGPRINAAGRLRRADAALELLLTADEARAAAVADELDLLNRERRDAETRALFEAEAERSTQDGAAAYVIAGEGWHPGVVGIVASRITERHHRPCVVISVDERGGRGSGRSVRAFDLHAALSATAGHLRRFGGHRMAAGLEIDPDRIDRFRRDFVTHAAGVMSPDDLVPVTEVDAVVPGTALGLALAEELGRLAPFGKGNEEPTLLVPATRVDRARSMGEDGQHARFTLVSSGSRAEAVAFRTTAGSLRGEEELHHAAVRLELNEWNRTVEARVVLSELVAAERGRCAPVRGSEDFWTRVGRELDGDPAAVPATEAQVRSIRDRRGEGIAGVVGDLLSSGEPVLVACSEVSRRRDGIERLLAGLAGCPGGRFGGRERRGAEEAPATRDPAALAIAAWEDLAAEPAAASSFPHVVALDPPGEERWLTVAASAPGETSFLHLAWGRAEVDFALAAARAALETRAALTEAYRAIRQAGSPAGDALRSALEGASPHPRSAAHCGRLLRVLTELGLVAYDAAATGDGPRCRLLAASRTALEVSAAYRAYQERLAAAERYLAAEAARVRSAPAGAAPAIAGAAEAAAIS
jgi:single-stranded-DNA-specific exonuclease